MSNDKVINKNCKFRGFVEDNFYPDTSHNNERGDFDTPEEAFEWAKKEAEETGFRHVAYWVEIDEDSTVDGFSGLT